MELLEVNITRTVQGQLRETKTVILGFELPENQKCSYNVVKSASDRIGTRIIAQTVRNRLHKCQVRVIKPTRAYFLRPKYRTVRRSFAKEYKYNKYNKAM